MPKRTDLKRVMVIGSGPIVIGQAAEFDYAGTQACRSLREEGLEVVLVNSNPATIMTDTNMADKVYVEPLTVEFLTHIIAKERPDGLLPTLGGQTGLNLATRLAKKGVLEEYGVELLGTPLESIEKAEDREHFKNLMQQIGEPVPESAIAESMKDVKEFMTELEAAAGEHRAARLSHHRAPRLYAGRHRRRHRLQLGGVARDRRARLPHVDDPATAARTLPARLERDRVRGDARRRG